MSKKKDIDEKLSDALNIDLGDKKEVVKKIEEPKDIVMNSEEQEKEEDFNLVRNNLKLIIETGQSAMEGILNVASEGESPRAYEVVSQLIKSVSDANKDLMDLHKKMKDMGKESGTKHSAGSITNNAIYVGSTKDLQKLVKESKDNVDTIDAQYEVIEDGKSESDLPRES